MTDLQDDQCIAAKHLDLTEAPSDLMRAYEYWAKITPEGVIGPAWPQFDLMAVPANVLPYTLVVDYEEYSDTYRYRFWGSRLTTIFGADYTGKSFDQLPSVLRNASIESYSIVVESRLPQLYQFDVFEPDQTMIFQYAMRLPLSNDGKNVGHIVSVLSIPVSYNEHRKIAEKLNL